MKYLIFGLLMISQLNTVYSQNEIEYNNPPRVSKEHYKIDCKDIISTDKYCKFKFILENPSNTNYLLYNLEKIGFEYENIGTYFPRKSRELVVAPNKSESKVIKIDGSMDYRIGKFNLNFDGLLLGVPAATVIAPSLVLAEKSTVMEAGITITCLKYTSKKGKINVQLEVLYEGASTTLISLDPSQLVVKDKSGNILNIALNKSKKLTLLPMDKEKLVLNFESNETIFELNTEKVFELVELSPIKVDKIQILSPNAVSTSIVSSAPICNAYTGPQNAPVRVKISNDEGVCFKLTVDGQPLIPEFTSNGLIYLNQGNPKLEFTLANGTKVQKSIYVTDMYDAIGYRLKEQKNGNFVVNYMAGEQVMNAKGEAFRNSVVEKVSSNRNTSTNSDNNNNSCYGEASTGTTTVSLKITWKGSPVSGNEIQLKQGGILGNNTTDSNGNVTIKINNLASPKIDVYGCRGSYSWSVTGDWVVLDKNNFYHLKLDEVAEFISEMMGLSIEEVGAGWGM